MQTKSHHILKHQSFTWRFLVGDKLYWKLCTVNTVAKIKNSTKHAVCILDEFRFSFIILLFYSCCCLIPLCVLCGWNDVRFSRKLEIYEIRERNNHRMWIQKISNFIEIKFVNFFHFFLNEDTMVRRVSFGEEKI